MNTFIFFNFFFGYETSTTMAVSRDYSRGNMFSAIFLPTVRMKNIRGILTKKIACPCVFFSVCLCFRRERERKRDWDGQENWTQERERDRESIKNFFLSCHSRNPALNQRSQAMFITLIQVLTFLPLSQCSSVVLITPIRFLRFFFYHHYARTNE